MPKPTIDPRLKSIFEQGATRFNQSEALDAMNMARRLEGKRSVQGGVCASMSKHWLNQKLTERGTGDDRIRQMWEQMEPIQKGQRHIFDETAAKNLAEGIRKKRPEEKRTNKLLTDKETGELKRRQYDRHRLELPKGRVVANWQVGGADIIANAVRSNLRTGLLMPHDFLVRIDGDLVTTPPMLSGHAIAWYVSGGWRAKGWFGEHVYLFDPNIGEVRRHKSELPSLVRDYEDYIRQGGSFQHENKTVSLEIKNFCLIAYDRPA